ncbi:amidophosphoribosyltransferase [Elusimicrobium simillimum]|uniref:amidophosphoribosyltransferase n=1 Tax=Elusimicrobium simillimum TaxID=3143438 RepID=UPI003C6F9366
MGGVIGVQGSDKAAELTHVGLFSVQHRGQESCGIAAYDDELKNFRLHRSGGLVMGGFSTEDLMHLQGYSAIGHVRYPTSGIKTGVQDAQPFVFRTALGDVAIALSGNIINTEPLIKKMRNSGAILQHYSETELIIHLLAQQKGSLENALKKTLSQIEGGYAAVMLLGSKLIAFRDPYGLRPLVLGKLGKTYIVASETSAIEVMGGKYLRDIEPAELLIINNGKLTTTHFTKPKAQKNCIFEQVYLSRPDSVIRGHSVANARMEMGKRLARQMKGIKADIVMPVPDSGFFAALGFAKESGLPFEMGLVRNHYMGRSFIKSAQNIREMVVRLKLLPIEDIVRGKSIVLVDDSLVRGTTSKKLIKILREHGAKHIHFALTSPPIVAPCFYGINTPNKKELIACTHTHEQIKSELGADSLTFITKANAAAACGGIEGSGGYCDCCFTGKYLTKISKSTLEKR